MNKIKIITYENFPFGGASANLIRYFSLSLSKKNVDIEVILPNGRVYGKNVEAPAKRKGVFENIKYKHLGYINFPQSNIGKLANFLSGILFPFIYLIRSNLSHKFDTLIIYNCYSTMLILPILFKYLFRKKLIIIIPEFYEKPDSKVIKWYNFYFGLRYFTKFADAFIPASHFLKDFLITTVKIKQPILVLPNLMDPSIFKCQNNEVFDSNSITIGYTGTPTRKDGVLDLLKGFSVLNQEYPNAHLLIIGDVINGNSVIPMLKEYANKLGILEKVTFTGLVPFSEIPKLICSCQILALTRPNGVFAEAGFPTKLGEYFACKKPILITKVGDIPKYFINEEHLIMVEAENIQGIAAGFRKIIENKELALKISLHGYEWMDKNLNYLNLSEKIYKFINS